MKKRAQNLFVPEATCHVSVDMILLEPFANLASQPGKDIRNEIITAFDYWLKVPDKKRDIISRTISTFHDASLLIDDIQDDSKIHCSQTAVHNIYGVPRTINASNYASILAVNDLFELDDQPSASLTDILGITIEELLASHRGRGLEIFWRDSFICPSEEEYFAMAKKKTGGLFRLAIKLMEACATHNVGVDYIPLVNAISLYVRIRDDVMNLQSIETKGVIEDITEGRFTLPIIHGIHADPSNQKILSILKKRTTDPELHRWMIDYLRTETKSFDYTLAVLCSLWVQTLMEIGRLGGNPALERIVDFFLVEPLDAKA